MRISIRGKLVAFIVLPILAIFCGVAGLTFVGLQNRLKDQAKDQTARLAAYYASELNGRFATVEQIALSTGAYLETNPTIDAAKLYRMIQKNVSQHPLVFGGAIAFQPYSFYPSRRLFCPYVCEDGKGGFRQLDIARSYDYDTRDWEWWWRPRELGKPMWTEPYFDEGAGDILMSTYSVPFYRNGVFWGIATIDIPLAALENAAGLDDLPDDGFAIIDNNGRFVFHPDSSRILHDGLYQMADRLASPRLIDIADDMAAGGSGVVEIPDWLDRKKNVWVYYAPIASTGWSFAATIPESAALAFVRAQGKRVLIGLAATLLLIVLAVILVSKSLTDPVKRLRQTVQLVASGRLDVDPIEIRSRDEIGDLGRSFNRMLADLRDSVKRLAEEEAARKAVEGELKAARQIQTSLLPRTFPPFPDREDIDLHAKLIPAKAVAGDFYDFYLLDNDTLAFVMADVSGKGVPAALFMAVARTLLRNLATVTRDPGEIFARCSAMLSQDNPGAMFVTCFMGFLDVRTGKVIYANAGHPWPYRVDAGGGVSRFGEVTGTMLGIFDGAEYETREERLSAGDHLVLYTDGVTEAEAPDGSMLDEKGFEAILTEMSEATSRGICRHVCERVADYQKGSQSDDVTVLVLGYPGVTTPPSTSA